jgi:hypothetical protein
MQGIRTYAGDYAAYKTGNSFNNTGGKVGILKSTGGNLGISESTGGKVGI